VLFHQNKHMIISDIKTEVFSRELD
jgi:hypothetical protein